MFSIVIPHKDNINMNKFKLSNENSYKKND